MWIAYFSSKFINSSKFAQVLREGSTIAYYNAPPSDYPKIGIGVREVHRKKWNKTNIKYILTVRISSYYKLNISYQFSCLL